METAKIHCPKCDVSFDIQEEHRGKFADCPGCGIVFQIPETGSIGIEVPDAQLADDEPEEGTITVACPACDSEFDVPDDFLGRKAQCLECEQRFWIPVMPARGHVHVGIPREANETTPPPEVTAGPPAGTPSPPEASPEPKPTPAGPAVTSSGEPTPRQQSGKVSGSTKTSHINRQAVISVAREELAKKYGKLAEGTPKEEQAPAPEETSDGTDAEMVTTKSGRLVRISRTEKPTLHPEPGKPILRPTSGRQDDDTGEEPGTEEGPTTTAPKRLVPKRGSKILRPKRKTPIDEDQLTGTVQLKRTAILKPVLQAQLKAREEAKEAAAAAAPAPPQEAEHADDDAIEPKSPQEMKKSGTVRVERKKAEADNTMKPGAKSSDSPEESPPLASEDSPGPRRVQLHKKATLKRAAPDTTPEEPPPPEPEESAPLGPPPRIHRQQMAEKEAKKAGKRLTPAIPGRTKPATPPNPKLEELRRLKERRTEEIKAKARVMEAKALGIDPATLAPPEPVETEPMPPPPELGEPSSAYVEEPQPEPPQPEPPQPEPPQPEPPQPEPEPTPASETAPPAPEDDDIALEPTPPKELKKTATVRVERTEFSDKAEIPEEQAAAPPAETPVEIKPEAQRIKLSKRVKLRVKSSGSAVREKNKEANSARIAGFENGYNACPNCGFHILFSDADPLQIAECQRCNTMAFMPLPVGRFWLFEPVGGGSMGSVYRACTREKPEEMYAVKILPRTEKEDPFAIKALMSEASIGKVIGDHPCLVSCVGSGYEDDEYYYAMEMIEGNRLDKLLDQREKLPEVTVLRIALDCLEAVHHAYDCGYLYCDMKTENVIFSMAEHAVVIDYGLCIKRGQLVDPGGKFISGSPFYLPPERVWGMVEGQGSIIYSMGMVMYHTLTGHTLYDAEEVQELMEMHVSPEAAKTAEEKLATLRPPVADVLRRMIRQNPQERCGTFEEATELLSGLLNKLKAQS